MFSLKFDGFCHFVRSTSYELCAWGTEILVYLIIISGLEEEDIKVNKVSNGL